MAYDSLCFVFTDDDLYHGDLAGDEVMVQGIDYTSVSPRCRMLTISGLV
jgi:hypothetical protein